MILVSGSLAYDRIMNFPGYFRDHLLPEKLHLLSVSFLIDRLDQHFGGTAGNIAYNLALLKEKPIILSSAGNDFAPYAQWQKIKGVNLSLVQQIKNIPTASAFIITDKADNQITGFFPGAMQHKLKVKSARPRQAEGEAGEKLKVIIKKAKLAIVSPGNLDDMRLLPKLYRKHRIPYIYDPGQNIVGLKAQDLKQGITGAKALIANDYELSLIQKKTGFTKNRLLDRIEILVTTLGEKGSIIEVKSRKSKVESCRIKAGKPKKVIDPTGAGDSYRAGFIFGLLREWPFQQIGQFASLVSVYTVEKIGTQTHSFNWNNLCKRYKENFKEPLT